MANKTIAQLDTISGAIDNATDLAILYDTSATKTVKTTIQNLLTSQLSGLETSGNNVVSAINELHTKITDTISEISSTETSPASSSHNPGELILYDGELYRTTSYIVIGESLTDTGESANIENITISECIKELYDVQTVLGNETLGTEATTVTGAIAEINNNIGSEEMGTDATTVTGAIAEHESDITSLNSSLNDYTAKAGSVLTQQQNLTTSPATVTCNGISYNRGDVFTLVVSDGGFRCSKQGMARVTGYIHVTGVTAGDEIGLAAGVYSGGWVYQSYSMRSKTITVAIDVFVPVSANQIIYIRASNNTAARGAIDSAQLAVEWLN